MNTRLEAKLKIIKILHDDIGSPEEAIKILIELLQTGLIAIKKVDDVIEEVLNNE